MKRAFSIQPYGVEQASYRLTNTWKAFFVFMQEGVGEWPKNSPFSW